MITNLTSYNINSYFCQKVNNNTAELTFTFDIPQNYVETTTHISVTSLNIPNTWYQITGPEGGGLADTIILQQQGYPDKVIEYSDGNYDSIDDLISDLQTKLNAANLIPGNTYTVTNNDTGAKIKTKSITITSSDNTLAKSIHIQDRHMQLLYGLQEVNVFSDKTTLRSSVVNLQPISELYVHSSICTAYNNGTGNMSNDIIASLNVADGNTKATFSLKGNMKPYSAQKNVSFTITDFDNEIINLNSNNWDMTICLFRYEETWLEKWQMYIEYELIKDHVPEKQYAIVQNY